MHPRVIAACVALMVFVAFAGGVLFERYAGTDAMIDWAGLRHKLALYQTRSTADRPAVTLPKTAPGRTIVTSHGSSARAPRTIRSCHPLVHA